VLISKHARRRYLTDSCHVYGTKLNNLESPRIALVENAALIGRDHILDVDEGVLSAVHLQQL
jgi:hypothetical protein